MKKSISLLLAAVMVFALAAIACADATTVTAWISDGAETVIYTSMFDDFNSKHDDIQVDYQFFAQDELLNKLQTAPIVGDTPDLIVIDGGKGQLSSVKEIFDGMGVEGIDLVSLAKREEEVFTLFSRESVRLDHSDYALQVLQRLRDEAHRFAITYHRTLRGKRALSSVLDGIEGIGRKRRMALMERFKDIYEIEKASVSQLTEVAGIGKKQAEAIVAYFSKEENHEI